MFFQSLKTSLITWYFVLSFGAHDDMRNARQMKPQTARTMPYPTKTHKAKTRPVTLNLASGPTEARFGKPAQIATACVYGGAPKNQQQRQHIWHVKQENWCRNGGDVPLMGSC